ncbi:MAG TPA: spermidine/putrescine ABC transporter substrate-binding protein [Solirubrobacterales bacterium]|nr:spermidine/putrescine ABC transporter substrate-binding protein [Solirubrobacterales bacterium]
MSSSEKDPRRITTLLAVLVAAAALAFGLAACGGGDDSGINGGDTEAEEVKLEGKPSGEVTISNWPLYIDKQTVPDFEKETGVKVKYIEDVNANEEFFAKMDPLLKQGESGGRSLFVVTDWMVAKMKDLGYLQKLDKSALPNFEQNLVSNLREPSFDPNREYSAPWQSGMTGIIVRKDLAPDVKSICDLFDPQYKGKVEMLNELRDTVPLVMKCLGIDPTGASEEDWMKAIDKIGAASESGQIRRFTGNDYAADLTSGNAVAVIGWSGDAVQLQADNPEIEWRMPTEGCILWSDNMVIPVGAPNPTAAEAFMDYVYDPENQAQIEAYVNYVSPVENVKPILLEEEPEIAKNQLIFPSNSFTKNCSIQPSPSEEEAQNLNRAFNAVLNG